MTGIFFNFTTENVTFVATDAHKLVRLSNSTVKCENAASFILPRKPAKMLKNLLGSEKESVAVSVDQKNIVFEMESYRMSCRQIEGKYTNYNGVIPQNNPLKVTVYRLLLVNAIRRISAFANQGTYLFKLSIKENMIQLSAKDIDFSISAKEKIVCQYDGELINIGFKAPLLIDILNGISSGDVVLELGDSSRAGIILPFENEPDEELLMLLMPMLLGE